MRVRHCVLFGVLATASLVASVRAEAQPVTRTAALAWSDAPRTTATTLVVPGSRKEQAPWWAPVASAVVPGSGQLVLGQQRSVAYLVAEVYLVVQALSARRDWDAARDEYRSIAADVARRPFGGDLPIGSWEYYEAMEATLESGVFDLVPGGAVDPETDESTYNGATWRLARRTHWPDPNTPPPTSSAEYQRALAFYEDRAIRDEFRWSWRDAQLQLDVYRQTISSANRSYQRSVNMVGLLGMNHLASLIDAYITVRIRRYGGVRVAGLSLDGLESEVHAVGDPAAKRYRISSAVRFVPSRH